MLDSQLQDKMAYYVYGIRQGYCQHPTLHLLPGGPKNNNPSIPCTVRIPYQNACERRTGREMIGQLVHLAGGGTCSKALFNVPARGFNRSAVNGQGIELTWISDAPQQPLLGHIQLRISPHPPPLPSLSSIHILLATPTDFPFNRFSDPPHPILLHRTR